MFEIEIRGLLTKHQFNDLKTYLEANGRFEKSFKRLSVEISPGFDPSTREWSQSVINLRIKKSDDEEKISLKYGDFASDSLEEYDIILKSGQFLSTLKMFALLGFDKGLIYFWESWVYELEGMEIKVSKYTDEYYMWEIEARDSQHEENAKKQVYQMAEKLNLQPLSKEEYRQEIDYQCHNIFSLYSLEEIEKFLN